MLSLLAAPAAAERVPVNGVLEGQRVSTTVDSDIARYYLEDFLTGRGGDPEYDARIRALSEPSGVPDTETLRRIARDFSVDFAALYFAQAVLSDPVNQAFRARFESELAAARRGEAPPAAGFRIAFVPGWLYVRDPATGADFARQRRLLSALGVQHRLIETHENGTIEDNARIVEQALAGEARSGDRLIVASASKGGPEALLALHALASRGQHRHIAAWINTGGILNGSPLADWALAWPLRWLVKPGFWLRGLSTAGVASMTTPRGADRARRHPLPPELPVINFIGVPMSGQVSEGDFGYARIRPRGPNDGLSLLPDLVMPGGCTLARLGLDHFFLDPELDVKSVALARTVMKLSRRVPSDLAILCRRTGA